MKVTKSQELKIGSLLSYIQMALGIVIGLIYTPVMIRLLGQAEYGLYSTASSTISMLSVLNLGFSSSYVRYYAKYKVADDREGINKLNGLFLLIFIFIGTVSLVCGLFLSRHLDAIFATGLTAHEYEIGRILVVLLTVNISISFPMSVFSTIITANEKFVFAKIVYMLRTIVSPIATIVVLKMGYRSVAMVAITLALSLICDLVYILYVFIKLKNRFVFHDFEKGLFSGLFVFTFFLAINMVVDQINWNIDKILLARYKGTEMVAVYAIGYAMYAYYQGFSTAISGMFTPRIHLIVNSMQERDTLRTSLTELMIKVGRIQFLVLGLVLSGFVFFGRSFIMDFWAGKEYNDSYYVALLLMVPATIPLIQNVGIEIQRAQNKHQFRSIAYFVMACANFAMSVVLCQKYGAIGSAFGTAISLILANGFIINLYYHKKCNVDVIAFWRAIIKMSAALIPPAIIGTLLNIYYLNGTAVNLIVAIIFFSTVYAVSCWRISMNHYEKNLIMQVFKKTGKGEV